jgi:hypothetical protein
MVRLLLEERLERGDQQIPTSTPSKEDTLPTVSETEQVWKKPVAGSRSTLGCGD